MILESKDVFDQLAEFDPNTGTYRLLSRKQHSELATTPPSGGYSIVDGTMLSLYRRDEVLYFRAGDREFRLTDDVISKLTREDNSRVFQLIQDGNSLAVFRYAPPVLDVPMSADPTPFIEEEDFDFLLFVHRVLTDTGRRNRVYSQ
ncbi:MAG: hypothetical protein AABM67_03920 [Acidobacteriota bacterium]